jgi:cytidylate kinase
VVGRTEDACPEGRCFISKAVRGKFYRKGAELRVPIYLEPKLHSKLERIARRKGKDVGEMVNRLLRKDIAFIEELTSTDSEP